MFLGRRRKNELIYNVVRSAFPDKTTVLMFYDYGASEYYPRSPEEDWLTVTCPGKVTAWQSDARVPPGTYRAPPGWITGINHATYDESFAQDIPFAFSAYSVDQPALTRAKFAVTAESARAQHMNTSTCADRASSALPSSATGSQGASVIPYISLGAGFRPNTTMVLSPGGATPVPGGFPEVGNVADFPFARACYDVGHDPDLSHASLLGGLVNQGGPTFNSSGNFRSFGPWELAKGAVFFPSVFETSCKGRTADPGAGGCVAKSWRLNGSTNIFDHFLSYIAGAHGSYTAAPA